MCLTSGLRVAITGMYSKIAPNERSRGWPVKAQIARAFTHTHTQRNKHYLPTDFKNRATNKRMSTIPGRMRHSLFSPAAILLNNLQTITKEKKRKKTVEVQFCNVIKKT